jgi:histidinol-phosphate/aromatic aminotransferase/cobyric acid decarboxylase-like protein
MQKQLPKVIKSYPSSNPAIAQQHLASVLKVNPGHLVIGNGATELITIIMREMVSQLTVPVPTFSEYIDKAVTDKSVKLYPLSETNDYQLNLDHYSQWIKENNIPSALIINPGNPTGELLSLDSMFAFLDKNRHLEMVIVDESFIDFAGIEIPSLLHHVVKYTNLLIVRSMSKHCGMPGLRLGYCCTANPQFLHKLRKALPVWNINTLAEYYLSQLLATDDLYHQSRLK